MKEKPIVSDIVQTFYDAMASEYDKFYSDWDAAVREEAAFLQNIFGEYGFDQTARVLDCACGIGTQAIGLAALGYSVTASDVSAGELAEAQERAARRGVSVAFRQADFRALSEAFSDRFDIVIAMDNALPHMLCRAELEKAVKSIAGQLDDGGLLVASIRDYDRLLEVKPPCSAPYVYKTPKGQRVLFQTWDWVGENYRFIQYVIRDEDSMQVSRFESEYRATKREEITELLHKYGCASVVWRMPEQTGFYQPVVLARK